MESVSEISKQAKMENLQNFGKNISNILWSFKRENSKDEQKFERVAELSGIDMKNISKLELFIIIESLVDKKIQELKDSLGSALDE